MACQVGHDLPAIALGCVLLSYPLHPPGKFQELRDNPLTQLTLPLLFIRGTRDEFSRQVEWDEVLSKLQSELVEVGREGWGREVLDCGLTHVAQ